MDQAVWDLQKSLEVRVRFNAIRRRVGDCAYKIKVGITFSAMTSWIECASEDMVDTTRNVAEEASCLSKKPTSCLRIDFRYSTRMREVCLSAVLVQQIPSAKKKETRALKHPLDDKSNLSHLYTAMISLSIHFPISKHYVFGKTDLKILH